MVIDLPCLLDHVRAALGGNQFDECVATGVAMEPAGAVRYARHQIQLARRRFG